MKVLFIGLLLLMSCSKEMPPEVPKAEIINPLIIGNCYSGKWDGKFIVFIVNGSLGSNHYEVTNLQLEEGIISLTGNPTQIKCPSNLRK